MFGIGTCGFRLWDRLGLGSVTGCEGGKCPGLNAFLLCSELVPLVRMELDMRSRMEQFVDTSESLLQRQATN